MRIAIIGSGISGIGAALSLAHAGHEVVVFEKDNRPGGHAATVDIDHNGRKIAVDTGFIVYNELNYPHFTNMLGWLGVPTQASDMSFSVSADKGRFEWCGRDGGGMFGALFAQRRNLLSPGFLHMLTEILRFQTKARGDLRRGTIGAGTLGDYLLRHRFSARLRDDYLVPMGAAIWSTSPARMLEFPAESLISFFDNHCLLQLDRPKWRTVAGGSRTYVQAAAQYLGPRLRTDTPVTGITRSRNGVDVRDGSGHVERFDNVVLATHAPDALAMLEDADPLEHELLGACTYAPNEVYLHCDARLMPRRHAAWASWNFLREGRDNVRKVAVTYWMNALQAIDPAFPVFVTLNPPFVPDPALTFERFVYDHPQFDLGALDARKRLDAIQGTRHTWYCGAWTGHGFHEDGLASGLSVAERLGAGPPWANASVPLQIAAE